MLQRVCSLVVLVVLSGTATTYQNAYVLNADGSLKKRYNMGGCTGCHGEAQVLAGTDYSYSAIPLHLGCLRA